MKNACDLLKELYDFGLMNGTYGDSILKAKIVKNGRTLGTVGGLIGYVAYKVTNTNVNIESSFHELKYTSFRNIRNLQLNVVEIILE